MTMLKLLATLVASALVLAVAGCGDDDEDKGSNGTTAAATGASSTEFVQRANTACAKVDLSEHKTALENPDSTDEYVEGLNASADELGALTRELRGLEAPADTQTDYEEMRAAFEDGGKGFRDAAEAAEEGDFDGAKEALEDAVKEFNAAEATARDINLPNCAIAAS